jgi:NAD-dependent deacetylase
MMVQVRKWLGAARHIAVLTGAGMSAESGVPTFRDAQTGLWAKFNPQQLATEEAFRANPAIVWDWYAFRREMIARVEPNAGHRALAAFSQRHPQRLTLITQNVDGLHQRAGSSGVLALHGSICEDKWLDAPKACCDASQVAAGSPPSLQGLRQHAASGGGLVRRSLAAANPCRCRGRGAGM